MAFINPIFSLDVAGETINITELSVDSNSVFFSVSFGFKFDHISLNSSMSFNNIIKSYNITRSMSRAGTPTDNPVIESKNGWLKKEMYIDFDINNYNTVQ